MRLWNGWGDHNEYKDVKLNSSLSALLSGLLGPGKPLPIASIEDVIAKIPKSNIPKHNLISTDSEIRLRHARGQSLPDWLIMHSGKVEVFPDGVAFPKSIEEVQALLAFASKNEINVIPYGGDHALVDGCVNLKLPKGIETGKYALAICRIEPENNVQLVLQAFEDSDFELIFIGNWEANSYGRSLHSKYKQEKNIHLLSSIYEIERLFFYRSHCKFYIHGHSAGGTNPSLVEMMHFQKPVFAYDCNYNRITMENKGHYFQNVAQLKQLMASIDSDLAPEMLEIARRNYSWTIIRDRYKKVLKLK